MSLARLKTISFASAEELCNFVNYNGISDIEQIVVFDYAKYILFYRE